MAYIYKITNKLNGKAYIGKTLNNVETRWQQHIRESNKEISSERPLYRAIRKYGVKNFIVEILEEVSEDVVNEKEIFWINYYNTYQKGYNATKGGDGKSFLDFEKIINDYNSLKNMREVAKLNNCSIDSVSKILARSSIPTLSGGEATKNTHGKKIDMLDKNTQEVLLSFLTQADAARYVMENKYSNIADLRAAVGRIGQVCRGNRKTFAGFKWRYSE